MLDRPVAWAGWGLLAPERVGVPAGMGEQGVHGIEVLAHPALAKLLGARGLPMVTISPWGPCPIPGAAPGQP